MRYLDMFYAVVMFYFSKPALMLDLGECNTLYGG